MDTKSLIKHSYQETLDNASNGKWILCLKYLGDDKVLDTENKLASGCYDLIWLLLSLILLLFWGCIFKTDNVAFAVNLKELHCFTLYEGKMLPSFLTAFCQVF